MEIKKFTKFELARMKRTAQNVNQYVTKKHKLINKIIDLNNELEGVQKLIDITDASTKMITGGYGSEDIIKKVVVPTDKTDAKGNILKVTTFEFIYPDTIVPPVKKEEETSKETTEETEVSE